MINRKTNKRRNAYEFETNGHYIFYNVYLWNRIWTKEGLYPCSECVSTGSSKGLAPASPFH